MSTLTLRIPPEMDQALNALVSQTGISKSDFAREALQSQIFIKQLEAIRAYGVPKARAIGIYTDEDVFEMVS